jgi:hypothetical protein
MSILDGAISVCMGLVMYNVLYYVIGTAVIWWRERS